MDVLPVQRNLEQGTRLSLARSQSAIPSFPLIRTCQIVLSSCIGAKELSSFHGSPDFDVPLLSKIAYSLNRGDNGDRDPFNDRTVKHTALISFPTWREFPVIYYQIAILRSGCQRPHSWSLLGVLELQIQYSRAERSHRSLAQRLMMEMQLACEGAQILRLRYRRSTYTSESRSLPETLPISPAPSARNTDTGKVLRAPGQLARPLCVRSCRPRSNHCTQLVLSCTHSTIALKAS
jgi:hypothetical protein